MISEISFQDGAVCRRLPRKSYNPPPPTDVGSLSFVVNLSLSVPAGVV